VVGAVTTLGRSAARGSRRRARAAAQRPNV